MIALSIKVGGLETIQIKAYRDGTITRIGAGSMPPIPIAAASHLPEHAIMQRLLEKVPDALVRNDIEFKEDVIEKELVYEVQFFSQPQNGWAGEQTIWGAKRIIRFELDLNTSFRSKVFAFVDSLIKDAIGLSNTWYFDALVMAIFEKRSNKLPQQTMIVKPENIEDLTPEFGNFLAQMLHSQRRWNFMSFPVGKTYHDSMGGPSKLIFEIEEGKFSYKFV